MLRHPECDNISMNRLHIYRRLAQAGFVAFFLLLPVFDLLRYDVAERTLYLLGQPWSLGLAEEFYSIAPSLWGSAHITMAFFLHAVLPRLVVLSVFPLLGFLLGRTFCGWLCPEGAFFEYADFLSQKVLGRRHLIRRPEDPPPPPLASRLGWGAAAVLSVLVIPLVVALFMAGFFIAPARVWAEVVALQPSFGLKAAWWA